jgi:hypothetical protein
MAGHAILSPSGFKAIMLCPAKPAMERGRPDKTSAYAQEGTNAHTLAAHCLEGQCSTAKEAAALMPFPVSDEMIEAVEVYLDVVRDYCGPDGDLFVEQAVPIGHITGEEGAEGTADAVILRGDEIIVIDLKTGLGVEVSAGDDDEPNPQLALYALGALEKFGLLGDFTTVRLGISQPRVSTAPSTYTMTVAGLLHWGETVAKPAAQEAREILSGDVAPSGYCRPHEDACRFCRAKADCPALTRSVEDAMQAEFADLTTQSGPEQEAIVERLTPRGDAAGLGTKLDAVPLVEMWCKAVRAEAETMLLAGRDVPGYKLVKGRKGARKWVDREKAEAALKSFRLKKDEMYDYELISPTSAEKLLGKEPRRWKKLADLISQSEGGPSVAPISDKRPAIEVKPVESEFEVISDVGELI